MHYTAWDSGLPRGFTHYEDYLANWQQLTYSSSYTQTAMYAQLRRARTWAERFRAVLEPNLYIDPKHRFAFKRGKAVTDDFLAWQDAQANRPFFAFLNYYDAHQPYYAPESFRRFEGANDLGMYRAAIAYLDAELDRLLSALRERGVLDNTLVVITSDHGELFGFKGLYGHAHNLYLNTIRVPLMLRLPGRVAEGVRISQPVTLRDLAATVMDLAAPGDTAFPGVSLSGTWRGSTPGSPVLVEVRRATNIEPHLPTARGDMQSLLDDQFQYIRNAGDGRQELFAYRTDTLQERDLATVDTATLAALRQRVADLLRVRR
jgi:arylsulfatase A-like enzyme